MIPIGLTSNKFSVSNIALLLEITPTETCGTYFQVHIIKTRLSLINGFQIIVCYDTFCIYVFVSL